MQQRVARGRVEISVTLQQRRVPALEVELNEAFLDALGDALERARARGVIAGPLTPGDLLRFPQALAIRERVDGEPGQDDQAAVAARVEEAVAAALQDLDEMRTREGAYLRADLDARRELLGTLYERVAVAAADGLGGLQTRLAERVA